MKITKETLKEMIRETVIGKLNEQTVDTSELVPEDISKYASKVDRFLHDTIEKALELHEEGEDMMRTNVLSSYEVQERNRFLLYRVGFLNNLISSLIQRLEDEHRQ